jgi:hypothetical protein
MLQPVQHQNVKSRYILIPSHEPLHRVQRMRIILTFKMQVVKRYISPIHRQKGIQYSVYRVHRVCFALFSLHKKTVTGWSFEDLPNILKLLTVTFVDKRT